LKVPGATATLRRLSPQLASSGEGPSDDELARSGSRIIAEAIDATGRVLARAQLLGVDGYTYTARMLACAALRLSSTDTQLAGAVGPLDVFGFEGLVAANHDAGLDLTVDNIT
jgi:hypothetical protein